LPVVGTVFDEKRKKPIAREFLSFAMDNGACKVKDLEWAFRWWNILLKILSSELAGMNVERMRPRVPNKNFFRDRNFLFSR